MDDLDEFLSPENRKIHEEQLRIASKRKPADKRAKHAANAVAVSVDYTKTDADTDRELARLAKLSIVDYEHERTEAAAKLDVRAPILDKLVTAKRPKEEATGQGRPLEFEEPEPWDASVNGAELLDEIETVSPGLSFARRRTERRWSYGVVQLGSNPLPKSPPS